MHAQHDQNRSDRDLLADPGLPQRLQDRYDRVAGSDPTAQQLQTTRVDNPFTSGFLRSQPFAMTDTPPLADEEDLVAVAAERQTLEWFLEYHHRALSGKLRGLSEEDARRRLVPSRRASRWTRRCRTTSWARRLCAGST
jgi:Protein of unknown function (DUF664)